MSNRHLPRSFSLARRLIARSRRRRGSTCLLWQGAKIPSGYGTLSYRGVTYYTHHAAWISARGPIPIGRWVLHTCDVRNCINIRHLYLGDAQDNANDRMRRRRHRTALGERNGLSKLRTAEIRAIRNDTRSQRAIAVDYDVSHNAIGDIKRGTTWRHVKQGATER